MGLPMVMQWLGMESYSERVEITIYILKGDLEILGLIVFES